jgi:hypothetical protein
MVVLGSVEFRFDTRTPIIARSGPANDRTPRRQFSLARELAATFLFAEFPRGGKSPTVVLGR